MAEKYKAAMVLSGVGDALGYRNDRWEYCKSGPTIHEELKELGGLDSIHVSLPDWRVSDDTVMHIATAEGLTCGKTERDDLLREVSEKYIACMKDMEGRKPGPTSILGCSQMDPSKPGGYRIPFNPTGSGCGAAMRAMCIGLRYPRPDQIDDLIAVSVECGRMTHHHPTGFLGSFASALFASLSVQLKPLPSWGKCLVDHLPKVLEYVQSVGISPVENHDAWPYFGDRWAEYLRQRGVTDGVSRPVFPEKYGVEHRDVVYASWSLDGWAGRSGHDAPMIAYDALLSSGNNWPELCSRSMFHAGDSDSTGVIAACCYGAMYGYHGVPLNNYEHLEYKKRLENLGEQLYLLANQ